MAQVTKKHRTTSISPDKIGLQVFASNNKLSEYAKITGKQEIIVRKPWGDESFCFSFKNAKQASILNSVVLPEQLVAIWHKNDNKLEFIYTVCDLSKNTQANRKFDYNYGSHTYKCYFGDSSTVLKHLATAFREEGRPDPTTLVEYRNLRMFRDYFNLSSQPYFLRDFYKDKKPLSFFIEGDMGQVFSDVKYFCELLNFYMFYNHRQTPQIIVLEKNEEELGFTKPCKFNGANFPSIISARHIDKSIITHLSAARKETDPRLKFIYYFQILEYTSYV